MSQPGDRALILVPTALELSGLIELGGFPGFAPPETCGFGPVSAAARTTQLLAERRPPLACLVGLAGALGPAALGTARVFARVRLEGVGVGAGGAFVPASEIGFAQWEGGAEGRIEEALDLARAEGSAEELLTVCAASADPQEAAERRVRHPRAAAEDMEAFGVALACRLLETPLVVVRGLSNRAGERDRTGWRVREALAAARILALERLRGGAR